MKTSPAQIVRNRRAGKCGKLSDHHGSVTGGHARRSVAKHNDRAIKSKLNPCVRCGLLHQLPERRGTGVPWGQRMDTAKSLAVIRDRVCWQEDGSGGAGAHGVTQCRIYVLLGGPEHRSIMETMQLLLLTVVLTLPIVEQSSYRNYQQNVTLDELLGKWYINRWAGNMPIPEKKKFSPLPPFTFVKNIIGKLEFRMNISRPIGCIEFKIYLNEIKHQPGVFYIWPKHRIVFIFVDGKDFAIAVYVNHVLIRDDIMTMLM
ncbi:uncharacterized protein LOC113831795, partial [Cricetulus griseus]|uniref:uncharacterized protein LOC113831795 n=1 Tax=Cricetulus griseus TaxID=10029 RepID=UPI000F74B107